MFKALSEANWQNCENLYHPENFSFSSCAIGFLWSYNGMVAFGMDLEDPASNEEINFFGRPKTHRIRLRNLEAELILNIYKNYTTHVTNQTEPKALEKAEEGMHPPKLGRWDVRWVFNGVWFRLMFLSNPVGFNGWKNLRIHPFLKGQSIWTELCIIFRFKTLIFTGVLSLSQFEATVIFWVALLRHSNLLACVSPAIKLGSTFQFIFCESLHREGSNSLHLPVCLNLASTKECWKSREPWPSSPWRCGDNDRETSARWLCNMWVKSL